eukprot:4134837-Prorocentrum_lima.AAC.1
MASPVWAKMLVYRLRGTRNPVSSFMPKLTQLISATSATVAALCSMSKRASASSTVSLSPVEAL